jgi:GNAT superfamily N-acetyltransferase
MSFEFIAATESDRDFLLELRKLTMQGHLEQSGQFLSDGEHRERLDYKYDCSSLVFHENELIGAVKYQSAENEVELIQIQIAPIHQGKGYGTGIIQQLLSNAKEKSVKLTVLKNSPAVRLYERLGFRIFDEDSFEYHMRNTH